jgi:DNA-binding NtrC family response regulator
VANILVAEDDPATGYLLSRTLQHHGHDVSLFESSIEAWQAARTSYDVLITDILFPQGQPHGVALSRHARSLNPGLFVVFITAHGDYADSLNRDDEIALVKPVDVKRLLDAIASRIGVKASLSQ